VVSITDAEWEQLHELRLRGFLPAPDASAWEGVRALGLVELSRGRVKLTPAGRDAHTAWAKPETGSPAAIAAAAAYADFGPLNQKLLKVCHDWQVTRGEIPNDHTDPAYDHRVVNRLRDVHSGARRVLSELSPVIARFDGYEPRFDHALEQLDTGARQWFASPACDSYHTVWMQFHEDLLLAVGRTRADEEAG
jgi:hypothetical protein